MQYLYVDFEGYWRVRGPFFKAISQVRYPHTPQNLDSLLDFSDRLSYFEWVAAWKAQYRMLAQVQRELRITLSGPHDEHSSRLQGLRAWYREVLRALLWVRMLSKAKAGSLAQAAVVTPLEGDSAGQPA